MITFNITGKELFDRMAAGETFSYLISGDDPEFGSASRLASISNVTHYEDVPDGSEESPKYSFNNGSLVALADDDKVHFADSMPK